MGPTFGGPPAGGRGSGPRPPPGQPSWESSGSVGRGRGRSGFEARGGARGRGRGRGTGPSPGRAGRGLPPPVVYFLMLSVCAVIRDSCHNCLFICCIVLTQNIRVNCSHRLSVPILCISGLTDGSKNLFDCQPLTKSTTLLG